ncbi:restriction endonuclease type ii ecorv [Trichococcus palustris]|uniref:Restriction endonuclease type ii ecorv n=1 Tax=Trichococcus palustris TaxID=140314 RepID=A0A143YHL6_9LACT|nr:type II restriction endonuclease [Trichococcus palustris]CZQ89100.1 restriction endonuclease type ii ecorv [Trichococcus palustris]SFL00113.1 Restriction endonuclease EcoRV [Trichococcus palustris]
MASDLEFDFATLFYSKVCEMNIDWNVKGLIANADTVYAIGNDSKLLGRIFEIVSAPVIKAIADEYGYIVKTPDKQNTYPDFTLMRSEDDPQKIAIDIKTTYKQGNRKLNFTLGSFTSFMRNNTKNIQYPYSTYANHYVIGFIYERNLEAEEGSIVTYNDLDSLAIPYLNVDYFVRKKKDINGQKKGSGNTDNMSSIICTNVNEFKTFTGPFSNLPKKLYLHYWRNYSKNTESPKVYIDLDSYFNWLESSLDNINLPEVTIEQHRDLLSYKQAFLDWKSSYNSVVDESETVISTTI